MKKSLLLALLTLCMTFSFLTGNTQAAGTADDAVLASLDYESMEDPIFTDPGEFAPDITDYTVVLASSGDKSQDLLVSAKPASAGATLNITTKYADEVYENDGGVVELTFSQKVVLQIVVTAESGNTRTYTVTFFDEDSWHGSRSTSSGNSVGTGSSSTSGFFDVRRDAYYYDAVAWAVDKKITTGKTSTTFGPTDTCTVSHILTFLWRAEGKPNEHGTERESVVAWANSLGIDTSSLGAPCTRSAAAMYMWKAAGSPMPKTAADFQDVSASADYADAVAWALEKGITSGTSATMFSPDTSCTRGQIVTFLYRSAGNKK